MEKYFPELDERGRQIVGAAYDIAAQMLADHTRGNGHPFIEHPLGVAKIAAEEIGLPPECLAAVFLHEAMRFSEVSDTAGFLQKFRPADRLFGQDVLTMVDGLNKISTIKPKDTRLEADNYKRLIVSYSRDPRVTVLKIADRLEVMRNLELFPKPSRERKVLESLMLYIPLAHQLGLYNMKSEMEDIYFRNVEPEQYRAITNKLKSTEGDRERLLSQFIEPLKQKLSDAGISYKLKVRTKTAYSIWRKMVKQEVPFEGVYDVFAIRFIIDCDDPKKEKDLCWDVYSYVTEEYESDTHRLRDWLSKPKPNGYESLHITVKNKDGAYLEVQIRTKRMDEIAESGLASHWSYKGIRSEAKLDSWLRSVRNILEHPDTGKESAYQDYELPDPPVGEIFVFTPSGELRKLPEGATVLDFAFGIHTNLGMRCTGAKVNGKTVSIREKLHTGDVVEIMSGKNQKPSADWVNYVVTSKARARIRRHLSELEFKMAAEGKELLERRLKNWKLELSDEQLGVFMNRHTPYKTLNAFYAAVGEGKIDIADIRNFIRAECGEERAQTPDRNVQVQETKGEPFAGAEGGSDDICVIGAKDIRHLDYKMAKCCNPVFGD
ncbi:MAG: HD domain-containing protein, partial [Bacteroidales bacterium]|nr:HD domain-containing protein [Bacteroidales bacterium]